MSCHSRNRATRTRAHTHAPGQDCRRLKRFTSTSEDVFDALETFVCRLRVSVVACRLQ